MLYYEEDWIAVNLRHSDPSNMGSLFIVRQFILQTERIKNDKFTASPSWETSSCLFLLNG